MRSSLRIGLPVAAVLLAVALVPQTRAAEPTLLRSPALCGADDTPETGIQGDIPRGDQRSGRAALGYNCGLSLVHELPGGNAVQGYGNCVYVRGEGDIRVFDASDPVHPTELASVPNYETNKPQAGGGSEGSETMRVVATTSPQGAPRALLASAQAVYDITNCRTPVLKGIIDWQTAAYDTSGDSHDIRISLDAKRIYAGTSVKVVDISNLDKPSTWRPQDYKCDVARQVTPAHQVAGAAGLARCDSGQGIGGSLHPAFAHGPDDNASGSRLYVGSQTVASSADAEDDKLRILDMTGKTPVVLDELRGPGHSVDWFRTATGREFVLHANEIVGSPESSCAPRPRPSSLGWAHEAFITEVTGDRLRRASVVQVAISSPENCRAKLASRQNTAVAYHAVDNPYMATFAMVPMGNAGFRLFDIRDPNRPTEVAYFNRGALQHAGATYYDAERKLLFVPGPDTTQVLEIQPQVLQKLGLETPTDEAYPRYPSGRAATPSAATASGQAFDASVIPAYGYCQVHRSSHIVLWPGGRPPGSVNDGHVGHGH